jgi:hypothetical protein
VSQLLFVNQLFLRSQFVSRWEECVPVVICKSTVSSASVRISMRTVCPSCHLQIINCVFGLSSYLIENSVSQLLFVNQLFLRSPFAPHREQCTLVVSRAQKLFSSYSDRTSQRTACHNYKVFYSRRSWCKASLFCQILITIRTTRKLTFSKKSEILNFTKIRPVGVALFHVDRWKNRHDETHSRLSHLLCECA